MRTKIFYSILLLAVPFVSCTKAEVSDGTNDQIPESSDFMELMADMPVITKTSLDGLAVQWSAEDCINVNGANSSSITIDETDAAKAVFMVQASELPYKSVYPASACSEGTVEVPSEQNFVQDSYDPSAAIMLGYSEVNGKVAFDHVMAYLKINVAKGSICADNIKSVSVKGASGENMSGSFTPVHSADGCSIVNEGSDGNPVVLNCGSNGIAQGSTVIIAVPAKKYSGLEITVTDVKGHSMTVSSPAEFDAAAGYIYPTTIAFNPHCQSPIEWPVGYVEGAGGKTKRYNNDTYKAEWTQKDGGFDPEASYIWRNLTQPLSYMQFNIGEDDTYKNLFKSEWTASNPNNYYSPNLKGVWTGYYFEFCIPVVNFKAGTEVTFTAPVYTRCAPLFWNVEYLDGDEWKCTKSVQKSPCGLYEKECTWVVPHGNLNGSFEGHVMSHTMTFENAVEAGWIKIRLTCADGKYCSAATTNIGDSSTFVRPDENALSDGSTGMPAKTKYTECIFAFVNKSDVCKAVSISWE